jgi:hypothetical protein
MPTWTSVSPRAGVVYDLFGNQKTAVKFSFGKFMQAGTTGFSNSYNPLALTTATVAWTDLNNDGVPQGERGCTYLNTGCELNLSQLPAGFGVAAIATFDPDIKRMYNMETTLSIQHELLPRLSVSAGWYPPHVSQPAPPHEHAAILQRLLAVHDVESDRRLADHLLQRQRRESVGGVDRR